MFSKRDNCKLGEEPCIATLNVIGKSILIGKYKHSSGYKLYSPNMLIMVRSKHNFVSPQN